MPHRPLSAAESAQQAELRLLRSQRRQQLRDEAEPDISDRRVGNPRSREESAELQGYIAPWGGSSSVQAHPETPHRQGLYATHTWMQTLGATSRTSSPLTPVSEDSESSPRPLLQPGPSPHSFHNVEAAVQHRGVGYQFTPQQFSQDAANWPSASLMTFGPEMSAIGPFTSSPMPPVQVDVNSDLFSNIGTGEVDIDNPFYHPWNHLTAEFRGLPQTHMSTVSRDMAQFQALINYIPPETGAPPEPASVVNVDQSPSHNENNGVNDYEDSPPTSPVRPTPSIGDMYRHQQSILQLTVTTATISDSVQPLPSSGPGAFESTTPPNCVLFLGLAWHSPSAGGPLLHYQDTVIEIMSRTASESSLDASVNVAQLLDALTTSCHSNSIHLQTLVTGMVAEHPFYVGTSGTPLRVGDARSRDPLHGFREHGTWQHVLHHRTAVVHPADITCQETIDLRRVQRIADAIPLYVIYVYQTQQSGFGGLAMSLAGSTANHPIQVASGQIHTEPAEATMAAHAAAVAVYLSNNDDFVSIRKVITDLLAAPPAGQRRYGSAYKQYKQTMALFNIAHRLGLSEEQSSVTVTVDGGTLKISWDDVAAWLPDLPQSYKNIRTKVIKMQKFSLWMDGQLESHGQNWRRLYEEDVVLDEVELLLSDGFELETDVVANHTASLAMDGLSKRLVAFIKKYNISLPGMKW